MTLAELALPGRGRSAHAAGATLFFLNICDVHHHEYRMGRSHSSWGVFQAACLNDLQRAFLERQAVSGLVAGETFACPVHVFPANPEVEQKYQPGKSTTFEKEYAFLETIS